MSELTGASERLGYLAGTNDAREVLIKRSEIELKRGRPEIALALAKCGREIGALAASKDAANPVEAIRKAGGA